MKPAIHVTTSAVVRCIRRLPEYLEWKKQVFIRDRFACQKCGRRNGRKRVIEADHITPLAQLVRHHQITTVKGALLCPALWDIANGRTLCHDCHEETESYPENFKRKKLQVRWI